MKIIGGKFKGRNIYMPVDIRPTQNVVREAIFDILGHDWQGITMLELCAGSGAVGIEALSRGAKKVTFVDNEPACIKVIQKNLEILKIGAYEDGYWPYEIILKDALAVIKELAEQSITFDIIFADPVYGRSTVKKLLKTLGAYDIVQPDSKVLIQHDLKEALPEEEGRFFLFKRKKYGGSMLSFYELKESKDS